jgi:hypothetical protein
VGGKPEKKKPNRYLYAPIEIAMCWILTLGQHAYHTGMIAKKNLEL